MAKPRKKQPRERWSIFTDKETHQIISALAKQDRRDIKSELSEIVYTHPEVKRFLSQDKQSAQPVVE